MWKGAASIAVTLLLAVAGGTARAGFIPAWSYLPASLRTHLAAETGGALFLPARTPDFYRYRSGATVTNGKLAVTFTNRVRIRAGVWQWTKKTFVWNAQRFAGEPSVDRVEVITAVRARAPERGRHGVTDASALEHHDPVKALGRVVGRKQAHDPTADDDEILGHAAGNSSGGVMGKMISLQSISVAAAATGMPASDEARLFGFTLKHSVFLACIIGLIVCAYAYA